MTKGRTHPAHVKYLPKSGEIRISPALHERLFPAATNGWKKNGLVYSLRICLPPPLQKVRNRHPLVSSWANKWVLGRGRPAEFPVCVPHSSRSTAFEARAGQQTLQQRMPNECLRQLIIKPDFAAGPAVDLNWNHVGCFKHEHRNNRGTNPEWG